MFQSSPSPKAGSYIILIVSLASSTVFQSSPSPKAGSYQSPAIAALPFAVSILSQPEGRELLPQKSNITFDTVVSILSQPEGRELPTGELDGVVVGEFQSSPSPKAGSYYK